MLEFEFKARKYLHFDHPISEASALALVKRPKAVARHAFLPFLGYTLSTLRIRRQEDGSIEKREKSREIRIASHKDAAIYSYYSHLLSIKYESMLEARNLAKCVRAFRSIRGGGTNIHAAREVFGFINGFRPCTALAFDIEKFFDTLNHDLVKKSWMNLLSADRMPDDHYKVFRSLTDYSWVQRSCAYNQFGISIHNPFARRRLRICNAVEFRDRIRGEGLIRGNPIPGKGIPQGSPISAVLSNIYMLDFDASINEFAINVGGLYRRYCDDIMLVIPPSREAEARQLLNLQIEARGLAFNQEKTDTATFSEPVDSLSDRKIQYLGFTYDGEVARLRLSSLNRYYGKMRRGVSLAKQTQRKYNKIEAERGEPLSPLRTRKLMIQYSYLNERRVHLKTKNRKHSGNFLSYVYKAAELLRSPAIKRQVRNHWKKLLKAIRN